MPERVAVVAPSYRADFSGWIASRSTINPRRQALPRCSLRNEYGLPALGRSTVCRTPRLPLHIRLPLDEDKIAAVVTRVSNDAVHGCLLSLAGNRLFDKPVKEFFSREHGFVNFP